MTLLKTLTKDGSATYVYSLPDERYIIEYIIETINKMNRNLIEDDPEFLEMDLNEMIQLSD